MHFEIYSSELLSTLDCLNLLPRVVCRSSPSHPPPPLRNPEINGHCVFVCRARFMTIVVVVVVL